MDVKEYVKLRCMLNNRDYKEIKDAYNPTNTFKVEKFVLDEKEKIKYAIKYNIIDAGEVTSEQYRYTANVSATFFINRKELHTIKDSLLGLAFNKYDSLSMYYNFCYYQDPIYIENIIENTWNHLNIFTANPYLNSKNK